MESIFSRLPYGFSFHFAPSRFSILRIQYTTPNPIVKEDMYAAPQAAPFILPVILEASLCATDPVRESRALRHNFC